MTHGEVKSLNEVLPTLIEYLVKSKVKNFNLYYGLNRNLEFMTKANEAIDKTIKQDLPELFEIEEKAIKLIQPLNEAIEKENTKIAETESEQDSPELKKLLTIIDGLAMLEQDEQDKHKALMGEYKNILEKESDIKLYMLKKENIENIEIDFWAVRVLSQFIEE